MHKLLLTSTGFTNPRLAKTFLRLVKKKQAAITVVFIPTASRSEDELRYVEESKEELLSLGITNIKIIDLKHKVSYDQIKEADCMYVCGGNTFYLMHKVREVGFGEIIRQFVDSGKVYVGVSAGSIIAGPDISIASPDDENDVELKNMEGLLLTDKVVSPHYKEKEKKIIDEAKKRMNWKIIPLTDKQALLIEGNKETIIE